MKSLGNNVLTFWTEKNADILFTRVIVSGKEPHQFLWRVGHARAGGHFKNTYELLNVRALKFPCCIKIISFNVWVRYFVWNFKGHLWNSTQNILPIHWKMWILFTNENLRALRFKSSYVFLKCPPELWCCLISSVGYVSMHIAWNQFPASDEYGQWSGRSLTGSLLKCWDIWQNFLSSFSWFLAATKQLNEWYFLSVCPSVTPFWLCYHYRIIMKFSGVITRDFTNFKVTRL